MGGPCHIIGITKDIRKKLGKDPGDIISVEVEKDEEERVVEVPKDFAKLMEAILKLKDKVKLWLYHSFILIVRNYDDF